LATDAVAGFPLQPRLTESRSVGQTPGQGRIGNSKYIGWLTFVSRGPMRELLREPVAQLVVDCRFFPHFVIAEMPKNDSGIISRYDLFNELPLFSSR
jgi:hypothetical protein